MSKVYIWSAAAAQIAILSYVICLHVFLSRVSEQVLVLSGVASKKMQKPDASPPADALVTGRAWKPSDNISPERLLEKREEIKTLIARFRAHAAARDGRAGLRAINLAEYHATKAKIEKEDELGIGGSHDWLISRLKGMETFQEFLDEFREAE